MGALVKGEQKTVEPQIVDTLGGSMHVRGDSDAATTPHGQLVFFAQFLAATGVFDRWVSQCPLPLMNPTTCDTAYFGGIDSITCTSSGIGCPSSTLYSFCAASLRNTSPRCWRSW